MSVLNEAEIEVMRRYSDQPTSNLQMVAIRRCLATITSQGKRIAFLEAQIDSLPTTVEYDDQRAEMETLRAALRDLWDYTGRDQYYYDPEHKAQLARLLPGLLDHTGVPVSPAESGGGEG